MSIVKVRQRLSQSDIEKIRQRCRSQADSKIKSIGIIAAMIAFECWLIRLITKWVARSCGVQRREP